MASGNRQSYMPRLTSDQTLHFKRIELNWETCGYGWGETDTFCPPPVGVDSYNDFTESSVSKGRIV